MERYIAVTRLSTKGQKGNWSEPDQLKRITEYANYRKWTLDKVISDVVSGTDFDTRTGILESLDRIKSKQATVVVYSDIDRLSRDFGKADEYIKKVYSLGGKIAISRDSQVFESSYEFLDRYDYELFQAAKERNKIIHRTQSKKLQAFQAGSCIQRPLYGYSLEKKTFFNQGISIDGKGLVLHPKRSKAVLAIIEHFLSSRSIYATLKWANEQGFESGLGKDSLGISAITLILHSHNRYAGLEHKETFNYQGKEYSRYITFPPIISEETSQKVADTLALRDKSAKNDITPFGKLAFCSCGKRAYWQKKQGHNSSFRCASVTLVRQYRNTRVKLPEDFRLCKGEIVLNKVKTRVIEELQRIANSDVISSVEKIIQQNISAVINIEMEIEGIHERINENKEEIQSYAPKIRDMVGNPAYTSILDVMVSEVDKLRSEMSRYSRELDDMKEELEYHYNALKVYGLGKEKVRKILDEVYADPLYVPYMPQLTKAFNEDLYEPVVVNLLTEMNSLIKSIKADAWEEANTTLAGLGLILQIPLGEEEVTARTAGIRLVTRPVETRKNSGDS